MNAISRSHWSRIRLIIVAVCLLVANSVAVANDIVCLSIVDDGGFPESPQELANTRSLIRSILTDVSDGKKPTIIELDQDLVTRDGILAFIKGLALPQNITLIVFYHGHGRTTPIGGHQLELSRGEPLLRHEVLDACVTGANHPGLVILFTDSCSLKVKSRIPPVDCVKMPSSAVTDLFSQHVGIVDINSSTYDPITHRGQHAYVTDSSFLYTQVLYDEFRSLSYERHDINGDNFVSWSEFFFRTRETTEKTVDDLRKAGKKDENGNVLEQTPQAFSVGYSPQFIRVRERELGLDVKQQNNGVVAISGVNSPEPYIIEWNSENRAKNKFENGDVFERVNGRHITNKNDLYRAVNEAPPDMPIRINAIRNNERYSAFIRFEVK